VEYGAADATLVAIGDSSARRDVNILVRAQPVALVVHPGPRVSAERFNLGVDCANAPIERIQDPLVLFFALDALSTLLGGFGFDDSRLSALFGRCVAMTFT
jgi:hypothetical protein